MSPILLSTAPTDAAIIVPGTVVDLSTLPSPAISQPIHRTVRHRDPMKALASLVAEALAAKFSDGDGLQLLRGLIGSVNQQRKRGLSISRLIDQYQKHCDGYYLDPDGLPSGEAASIRRVLKALRKKFGRTRAEDFKPLRLKALREDMVAAGGCRKTINAKITKVKAMFSWAVENELIAPERIHALQAVAGLKMGRTTARESEPVKPADEKLVEATLPHLSAQVAAVVRVQLLTGMRPGEVLIMRTCDIDRSTDIWVYVPRRHKTARYSHTRQVFIGPKAQEALKPLLKETEPEAYIFSAAEADEEWRKKKHAARKTPMNEGNTPGSNCKRRPHRRPGSKYRRDSYTRAITRACEAAFPVPVGMHDEVAAKWRKDHHWHPHQLRHNAATLLRKLYGIDAAQIILGHKTLAVTAIYAEKDMKAAVEIMRSVG